jgi:hypothetical protein
VELSRQWGRARRQHERGKLLFLRSQAHSAAYHVFTASGAAFWSGVAVPFLADRYPALSQPLLTTQEIEDLLNAFVARARVDPTDFRIQELTYRSRLTDPKASRQQESDRRWTDLSMPDAFAQLRELDASLERIRFEFTDARAARYAGSLGRGGEFTFAGNLPHYDAAVLQPCAEIAGARIERLAHRERREETNFQAQPFFITYDTDILDSSAARRRLVQALSTMTNSAHSVFHGNPYVHLALLDYVEDTSCDIYVMSPNRITVVPQTRSTPTSLERIYAHICREFGDGTIQDFSEVYA